ncbi:MAG: phosphate signaling complex protein PhoU [Sandaracinaceae bacterium]
MSTLTSRAYDHELRELRERILIMGSRCERLIDDASQALGQHDAELAQRVGLADRRIDADELAIDELAVRILALRQPAGRDLRFLVTALKVVTDLERSGDEAVNTAERALQLTRLGVTVSHLTPKLQEMAAIAKEIVHEALDAFVARDADMARAIPRRDDEVDEMYGDLRRACLAFIEEHPEQVEVAMCLASTNKYLERIADHACNIAAMVVFMASGEDVRHPAGSEPVPPGPDPG